jgi:hypothetical protein
MLFFIFAKYLYNNKNNLTPKPFFSFARNKLGGPAIRTERLKKVFGNNIFNFNIIYAQSYWSSLELLLLISLKKKKNIPVIFNQNGWYYNGWYEGDSKYRNLLLLKVQKISYLTIYQSSFCKSASQQLNNYIAANNIVLHNCIPDFGFKKNNIKKINGNINIFAIGYFKKNRYLKNNNVDINHIFYPIINAFYNLIIEKKNFQLKLNILGIDQNYLTNVEDFEIIKKFQKLFESNSVIFHKSYSTTLEYKKLLEKIDISLHLKYKDPCPNAVIERLKYGIPHIFSNSGGSPELIEESGIGLDVKNVWDTQLSVSHKDLEESILKIIDNYEYYSFKSLKQSEKFSWKEYIQKHKSIFEKSLL